jgi:hypothetical protein
MGTNSDGEIKRKKARVLHDIKWLDDKAEAVDFDEEVGG